MSAAAPPSERPSPHALAAYGLEHAIAEPLGHGLINRTWLLRDPRGARVVLQAVNPIFPAGIHEDIEAVTRHLESSGLATPRLIRTREGALCIETDGHLWRALSYVEGVTTDIVAGPEQARRAGALLGRFHLALADLDHEFENTRLGVHDTARHLATLRAALAAHPEHRQRAAAAALAERVLGLAAELPPLPTAPDRTVHGDPKISNVVFDRASGDALCLIDLDTLARMPVALELGDALRSWCNPAAEDTPDTHVSVPLFTAAVAGYADVARSWLGAPEWEAIVTATLTITVELAARFCADALEERYFAWDPARYPSASEHNLSRTRGQLALAGSLARERLRLERALHAAFRP